jgi:VanZ family protein
MASFSKFNGPPRRRWALWIVLLAVWTTLLVLPMPRQEDWPVKVTRDVKFYIGKSVHLVGYGVLTVLAGWLQPRFRWRLLLLFFLMAHAGATEWAQKYVPSRTGTVPDVVLNHAGVLLGLIVSWKWWSKESG